MRILRPLITALALLIAPAPAGAFDCDFYQECCFALVEAYREAGVTGMDLENFERTCTLHHVFDAMPGAQQIFCLDAWDAMSRAAYAHYLEGRIGFYPEMCMAGAGDDPDEVLEPDESIPEPGEGE